MADNRSPAEIYRDMMRAMRADVGFRPDIGADGRSQLIYRGPRGEIGVQPIYRGQEPERVEQE